jgi:hypothetical protein
MNIDVTVLQTMPEIAAAAPGLRPKRCLQKTRMCNWPTCRISYVVVA